MRNTWYPQGRIDISIENGDFYKDSDPPTIPESATVLLAAATYQLFDASAPSQLRPSGWSAFCRYVMDKTRSNALTSIISDIITTALPDKNQAKNDYIFKATNKKFYRVLLVQHSVYGNRRRDFIINLVETLEKVQSGKHDTTALIAGIVLGSKYRSIFFEDDARYTKSKLETLEAKRLADEVTQMLRDIDRITADAAADGLADISLLQELLGNNLDVRDIFNKWWSVFPPMESSARQLIKDPTAAHRDNFFSAYDPFLVGSREGNIRFLELCWDQYRKHLV